jgi:protoheme IX farnesyltransferase
LGGLLLFAILFLWQVPHFVAISLFRASDYARAGLQVYGVARGEASSKVTIALSSALLVVVGILPSLFGFSGRTYLWVASILGACFFGLALLGFRRESGDRWSKQLFGFSILYLMVLLATLVGDSTGGTL